jgi:hypothetical protein
MWRGVTAAPRVERMKRVWTKQQQNETKSPSEVCAAQIETDSSIQEMADSLPPKFLMVVLNDIYFSPRVSLSSSVKE